MGFSILKWGLNVNLTNFITEFFENPITEFNGVMSSGINTVPATWPVQKHSYFVSLFVSEFTGLYRQNWEKNRIPADERKTRKLEIKWLTVKENTM